MDLPPFHPSPSQKAEHLGISWKILANSWQLPALGHARSRSVTPCIPRSPCRGLRGGRAESFGALPGLEAARSSPGDAPDLESSEQERVGSGRGGNQVVVPTTARDGKGGFSIFFIRQICKNCGKPD